MSILKSLLQKAGAIPRPVNYGKILLLIKAAWNYDPVQFKSLDYHLHEMI